jgi:hypothetical protein
MWEEEFLSEDVGVTVLTDRNFVPRDEDWAGKCIIQSLSYKYINI